MSTTTETTYVRGTTSARLLSSIEARFAGYELHATHVVDNPFTDPEPELPAGARQVAIARKGSWFALQSDAHEELDIWGAALSKHLARSVLTLFTWDGEATVAAQRWKNGVVRVELELLRDAYRGADGRARASAKVLWPWLAKAERKKILRSGIVLSDQPDVDGDDIFVTEDDSSSALLRAIGAPEQQPWYTRGALKLVFVPSARKRRR